MKRLKKVLYSFLALWLLISLGAITEKYLIGVLVQWAVDDLGKLKIGVLLLLAIFVFNYLLNALVRWYFSGSVERAMAKEREHFQKVFTSVPLQALEQISHGEALSKLTVNLERIQNFVENICPRLIQTFVEGVLAFTVCIYISPILSLAAFGSIPLIIFLNVIASLPLNPLIENRNHMENVQDRCALSFLEQIRNVRCLGLEAFAVKKYDQYLKKTYEQSRKMSSYRAILTIFDAINFILPYAVTFGIGTALAINGKLYVGEMVSFAYLMNSVTNLLGNIQPLLYENAEYKKSLKMLSALLETIEKGKAIKKPLYIIDNEIRLENVSFSYKTQDPCMCYKVLKNIFMVIKPGEKIAIIGQSGSGKSTLLKLMMGLYSVDSGSIHIPIREKSKELGIACLNQEMFLLPGSFRENIQGGWDDVDEITLHRAARLAEISSFIEQQPMGYDTYCSAEALSGGERQRLCLARALAGNPSILLCDEPTADLDRKTAIEIMNNILYSDDDRTVVVVTHNLEFLEQFDRIYELKGGRLTEISLAGTVRKEPSKHCAEAPVI